MKFPIQTLIFSFLVFLPTLRSEIPAEAIDPRFAELASKPSLDSGDVQWLEDVSDDDEISQCIATALLFKHDKEKYLETFHEYFRIDKTSETKPQATEVINDSVNGIMKSFKGRSPLETVTRIYLRFKGTNETNLRKDGSEIYLEMMFRASVFQGVFNTSKEGVLELSAAADYKKMNSNQSSHTTPASAPR